MGFSPSGGGIGSANDVAFSNPADGHFIAYDASVQKWVNRTPHTYNVRDYGAVGDGTTDDSAAIMAAINAANGQWVELPAGDYRASLTLADQPLRLRGPGRLVQPQATTCLKVTRTLGSPRTINSISDTVVGNSSASNAASDIKQRTTRLNIGGPVADYAQGDVLHLSSQDPYPWSSSGTNTYQAEIAVVHGIGQAYTGLTGGGFDEGDTIVGATSGATGVARNTNAASGNQIIIFSALSGDFVTGEALRVGGTTRATASGTPFLILFGRLHDAYTISPVIRKMNTAACELDDVKIVATGDTNQIVGNANRGMAIRLEGVVGARLRLHIQSAWGRGIQLNGCYRAQIDARVDSLPNYANSAESGYGYGVETFGATEYCDIRINGSNLRHGYTTNITTNSAYAFTVLLRTGTAKHNFIHDSIVVNSVSTAFDTHEGSYYETFDNCHAVNLFSGARYQSNGFGFNNRGHATTYRNCTVDGCIVGFSDGGPATASSFKYTTRYINCTATNYQFAGFKVTTGAVDDNSQVEYSGCEAVGDGSAANDPYYQYGFELGAVPVTLLNCRSSKFNGAPYHCPGGARSQVTAIDCIADYRDVMSSPTGFRLDGTLVQFNLIGYTVRLDPSDPTIPTGVIRNASGANSVNTDGSITLGGTARPLTQISSGSLAINVLSRTTA